MKVLLLGATGNLGVRCIQALLAHKHDVTLYVRNPAKLRMMVSPAVTSHVTIVVGDALDSAEIKKAILDHDIAGIVNVAGNQVAPWKEPILPKIARAVTEAAVAVGRERKIPLRAWLVTGVNVLRYPGTTELLNDHMG
jgi:putative NADH-flavin reductase